MSAGNGEARPPATANAPTCVNEEKREVIALLREAVELLTAIHNLENEQLHVLRSINCNS